MTCRLTNRFGRTMAAPAVTPPGARHSCEFKYRVNVESASNNYLQTYLTTNYYNQTLFAILGGLKSGGLKSGGLKSGGLMSGGLKSAHGICIDEICENEVIANDSCYQLADVQ